MKLAEFSFHLIEAGLEAQGVWGCDALYGAVPNAVDAALADRAVGDGSSRDHDRTNACADGVQVSRFGCEEAAEAGALAPTQLAK